MRFDNLSIPGALRLLGRLAMRLANRVEMEQSGGALDAYVRSRATQVEDKHLFAAIAEAEYRSRQARHSFIDADLLGEPAWDLLLDLYVNQVHNRSVSVTDACIASAVAPTTALRWINALERRGYVVRSPDGTDGRRFFLRLKRDGLRRIEGYLAGQLSQVDGQETWPTTALNLELSQKHGGRDEA